MTTERTQLDEQVWVEFGKDLLYEKGSSAQARFCEACLAGKEDFMGYIHDHLLSRSDHVPGGGLVDLQHEFTEKEFLRPPKTTQEAIWDAFKNEPIERLYNCACWGNVVLRLIEAGYIEPCHLASNLNGINETGAFVIDEALKESDAEKMEKKMDDCVRRILRSMCNPEPRGKRIVFNDFPLGKSYWRWHWAHRMHQHIGLSVPQTLEILDEKNYGEFSASMHSAKGQSYISAEKTLGGLLLFLAQEQSAKRAVIGKRLRNIINNIGYLSAWKAIETQDMKANQADIEQIAKSV